MGVSSELSDAPLSQVYHMAVDAKQRVFVPGFKESVVFVFAADGSFAKRIGRRGMRTITSLQLGTCMPRTSQTSKLSDGSSRIARGACCKRLTNCSRRKTSGSVLSSNRSRGQSPVSHTCINRVVQKNFVPMVYTARMRSQVAVHTRCPHSRSTFAVQASRE